jgi:NADP-dependent aldehyde dehydrogenase
MGVASRALRDSGFDSDVLLSVRGMTAGVALIENAAIKAGAFTGSQRGGRAFWDLATRRAEPIPFYGEMGSANPVFISQAALAERGEVLAEELAASLTLGLGQFCTKPSVVFVVDQGAFLEQLAGNIEKIEEGHLLSPASLERFRSAKNRVSAVRGVRKIVAPEESQRELLIKPGLLGISISDFLASPGEILEECFGPLGVVVECSAEADFDAVIDQLEGTLVSTVQASPGVDKELVGTLVDRLSDISGRVVVNSWPTGLSVTPWQHHGGPYPATTSALHTSLGLQALLRFVRPVVLQNAAEELWPNLH